MTLHHIPPAAILMLGALLVPLLKGRAKAAWTVMLPAFCFYWVFSAGDGHTAVAPFLGFELEYIRVDRLSKAFGYIFTLNATVAFIYAFYLKNNTQYMAALFYIGASLGSVFAGDLITLYMFWEVMAIASTFLILARCSSKSQAAALRYILIHIFGGLVLLAGVILTIAKTGDISFTSDMLADRHIGSILIICGFLINAGAVPLGAWLPDAYPEATVTGGIVLSAYTSKTAVYTLLRGFPGWDDILIPMGCAMALYGIIYALLENDMRRILAYSIINQVGFMVVAAGIGTPEAINGAVAHAFCHIIYKALLWMSAGAVLHLTLRSKCTELGGLYKTMPWALVCGTIGAMAISAVPGTSGFTSKSIIIYAAELNHLFWPWLVLETASAGVFLHAGIKFPYFVFFNQDVHKLRPDEKNHPDTKSMKVAMAILAFLCIFLGVYPDPLYAILPYQEMFQSGYSEMFPNGYTAWTTAHVVTQFQLLLFSGWVFFLFLKMLKRTPTIAVDADFFYRMAGRLFYRVMDKGLNRINAVVNARLAVGLTKWARQYFKHGPSRLFVQLEYPFLRDPESRPKQIRAGYKRAVLGTMPIGVTAFIAVLLLAILFFI